ncbi:uncharacterized protein [Diabrotica undecimpunctata]|uniref:uncharacterized protein n=1 Tax=Diabrotica undecimpunctata TaxID=50387 RepID=UPI003B63E09C
MTDDILDLMEQRRLAKNNETLYNSIQKEIRRKIREAKSQHLAKHCHDIEELENRYDTFNMYKKVKEAADIFNKKQTALLQDEHGKVIFEVEDKLKQWDNYVTNVIFEDDRSSSPPDITNCDGPLITSSDVIKAIQSSKDGRATGPDEIPTEIYKLINDSNVLEAIISFLNTIYTSGQLPNVVGYDLKDSDFL